MTLSGRNIIFKAGIILAVLCAVIVCITSFDAIKAYSQMSGENIRRPNTFFQDFISNFLKVNFYSIHASLSASVLYSLVSALLIYFYFEKTQAPEILFVYFFSLSLSLEAARITLPLHIIHDIPAFYQLIAARILLFGRYFGMFSLFTASVCAAGLDMQKTRNYIQVIFVATLIIALGVTVDTQVWDSSMSLINGYPSLFRLIEAAAFLTTVISFFIAAKSRGSRDYAFVGIGSLLALAGRNILLNNDTWAGPGPGILLLAAGTWFICTRLHKIYLWL